MAQLSDEERLQALRETRLLDSAPEEAFDRLTLLASTVLQAPVALVSLVDDRRQFFKSCVGLPAPWDAKRETPLSHSFCKSVVISEEPLVVNDARSHPQLQENGAVTDLGVVAYLGVPLTDGNGIILGSFCVIDVRPRPWSETDVRTVRDLAKCVESEIKLRQLVRSQQTAITSLQQRSATHAHDAKVARSLSKRKSDFLAQLGHELRNPLAPILNAAQLLADNALQESEKPAIYTLINQQLQQVLRLVNDMLDVARIERGKIQLAKDYINLGTCITQAAESTDFLFETKSQQLEIQLPSHEVTVFGDHGRLVQVVCNLLTNASRYTPTDGHIQLTCGVNKQSVELAVSDTGIGMSANSLENVFESFEQADHFGMTSEGGLGLGLALVKELVVLHDGTVDAHSRGKNRGSTFRVILPLAQERPDTANANRYDDRELIDDFTTEPRLTALIVEDTRAISFMFRRLLQAIGHEAKVAANVEEAWAAIDHHVPGVVFSDIEMPDVNGYEFVKQLKQDPRTHDVPVVAVTGSTNHVHRMKAAGFDYYLPKPVHIEDIRSLLKEITSRDTSQTPV